MNGRRYFEEWENRLAIAGLDPASVQEDLPPLSVEPGPSESRVGGQITRDLKRLTPEEIAERRERSESFLKQPIKHFPAEEAADEE
jgi:hypothetical protein